MKKRKLVIFLAITSVLVGGTMMSIQKQTYLFKWYSTEQTPSPKEQRWIT